MHIIAFALLFAVKGTLCFSPKDCTPATAAKLDVTAASTDRRFVWMSDDGAKVVIGTIPAKTTAIDLEATESPAHDVTLTLHGEAKRGWPNDVHFKLTQGKSGWEWIEPAKVATKPMTIHLPAGRYELQIAAEHHRTDKRRFDAHSDVALRDVTLAPLPVISGRVVTQKKAADEQPAKDVPVANAQILVAQRPAGGGQITTTTKPQASTDEQGAFRTELPEPEPFEIVVAYPGLAKRLVHLALSAPDTVLGVIRMSPGSKMNVHLDRADSLRGRTLHVTLYERSPMQYENTFIDRKGAKSGSDDFVFENLGEGEYYVVVSGDEPLENLTTVVQMKNEDVTQEIRIAPFTLAGSVKLGEEPVGEGRAGINERHHTWQAESPIDAEGRFGGSMWQRDMLSGFVTTKELGTLPVDSEVKLEGDPAPWDIRFKRRTISGRIFDEETKQPIANATLGMVITAKSSGFYSSAPVHDDGTYSIVAMKDGSYDLQAKAPDHVALSKSIAVAETDGSQSVDFPLGRGVQQTIEFVWPTGEPVANAFIVEGVARDGYNPAWMANTDAAGKLDLRSPANTARTLFIIPKEASFAPVHVPAATADAQPMHVVVPAATGSLTLNIVTSDQKPARGRPEMRYNGEWVPASVLTSLSIRSGMGGGGIHYTNLPAGAYELWVEPARKVIVDAVPSREPVRVGLSGGEQTVTVELPTVP
jgi:hypothetical protein